MPHAIEPGMIPPVPGQEKEEPDLWQEDDIPIDQEETTSQAEERGE